RGDIRPALVDQVGDEGDHLGDVVGGVRRVVGTLHPDGVHRLPPDLLVVLRDLGPRPALASRPIQDLVVDVGDVRHVRDVVSGPLQIPSKHVEHQGEASVTEVGRPVDRGPAHVHRHLPRLPGAEGEELPRGGVVQSDHGAPPYRWASAALAVAGAPLVAVALALLAGAGSVGVAVAAAAGVALGVPITVRTVLAPMAHRVVDAHLAGADARADLDALRRAVMIRDRFDDAVAAEGAEAAVLHLLVSAALEVTPDADVSLLLSLPDEPRVAWSVRSAGDRLLPAEPVPERPSCVALATGRTAVAPSSTEMGACGHLRESADGVHDLDDGLDPGEDGVGSASEELWW